MFRLVQLVSYACYLVTHIMYLDGSDLLPLSFRTHAVKESHGAKVIILPLNFLYVVSIKYDIVITSYIRDSTFYIFLHFLYSAGNHLLFTSMLYFTIFYIRTS